MDFLKTGYARFLSLLFLLMSLTPVLFSQSVEHVVLVIIDGARYSETLGDPLAQWTPNMHRLAQQGVVVDSFFNDGITITKSAIPAIWCGSWSAPQDTIVNGIANQYATVPTVWEYFRKSSGLSAIQALYMMRTVSAPWIQSYHPEYGPNYWPSYILFDVQNDMGVWEYAKVRLMAYHPALSVLYLSDVDSYGGSGVWTDYTHAIQLADSIVGLLWDFVQGTAKFQGKTTVLVTNDHGRHSDGVRDGFKYHGDGCPGCRHIMFLGLGAGVPQGVHTSVRHVIPDITPTIGSLLHFPTPYVSGSPMLDILTSVEKPKAAKNLPASVRLEQNYPNPFNPVTAIKFEVRSAAYVQLTVYDLYGREVSVLAVGYLEPGSYSRIFDGSAFSSGVYFYRLEAQSTGNGQGKMERAVKQFVLLK